MKVAEASRSVLLVLTPQFLATEWTRPDFRAGLLAALAADGGRKPVIVLLLGGGQLCAADLEPSLRLLLHSSLLLSWSEPGCLQQLEQALLYAGHSSILLQQQQHNNQLMSSTTTVVNSGGGGGYYYSGAGVISSPPTFQTLSHHYYGGGGGDHFHHHQTIYSEVPEKQLPPPQIVSHI